jgi:hypothetical protein
MTNLKVGRPSGATNITQDLIEKVKNKPKTIRMTLNMPENLHTKVKVFASRNRKTIIGVISELIESLPD